MPEASLGDRQEAVCQVVAGVCTCIHSSVYTQAYTQTMGAKKYGGLTENITYSQNVICLSILKRKNESVCRPFISQHSSWICSYCLLSAILK